MKALTVYVKDREAGVLGKFRDGSYEFRYGESSYENFFCGSFRSGAARGVRQGEGRAYRVAGDGHGRRGADARGDAGRDG